MEYEDEEKRGDAEDRLLDELAAQGLHENLSFFAFTATPKEKTLQIFGTKDGGGRVRPYHIYSMRQAIEQTSFKVKSHKTGPRRSGNLLLSYILR